MNVSLPAFSKLFAKHAKHKARRHPNKDWAIIAAVFCVCFFIILAISVYLFYGILQGKLFLPEVTQDNSVESKLNVKSIKEVSDIYEAKAAHVEVLKAIPPPLIDPAL